MSLGCGFRVMLLTLLLTTSVLESVAMAGHDMAFAFLQHRARHGYDALLGIPVVASRPVVRHETQISLEHANQFSGDRQGSERLLLDGETSELVIRYRRRLDSCWQLEAHLPFISHSTGLFDRAIHEWHEFFGFPDADRDMVGYEQISYSYVNGSEAAPQVSAPQSGVGDVQLAVQRSMNCLQRLASANNHSILRFGLKLPTGNAKELRGSGQTDVFADIQSPVWRINERWSWGASIGMLVMGDSEELISQRPVAAYSTFGLNWQFLPDLSVIAQLHLSSPFYASKLSALGGGTVSLITGGRYELSPSQSLEISISEDIKVDSAPDISARLAWVYRH
ncbi:MAG: DUF3187 family protein [Granulosicoccus sp.]